MDGIVFFATQQHDDIVAFYRDLGAEVWRAQPDCTILQAGSFRFGFCARDRTDTEGILTFVFEDRADVDSVAASLEARIEMSPRYNETYDIYQCFATDPDGRTVEFQTFE